MSPFSHWLHAFRMHHNIRQSELAELIGCEQSYISALEVGLKGPPTSDFVERLAKTLPMAEAEVNELLKAIDASQRKFVIDADTPEEIYWLLHDLRAKMPRLKPAQVRAISQILQLTNGAEEPFSESRRRLRRRTRDMEAAM